MRHDHVDVRLAGAGDEDALERAGDAVFDHAVRRPWLEDFLANPSNLLAIALSDAEVVGMASGTIYAHPDKPRQLFVIEVGVADRFQRRGVGAALVRTLLERGRALGCDEAWVATEDDNRAARALYASVGGVEDVERAVVYTFPLAGERAGAAPAASDDASGDDRSEPAERLELQYRFATVDDLDRLAVWNRHLIDDEGHRNRMTVPELRERMEGWLAGAYRAVVFELGGRPAAYALFREGTSEVHLRQFFVDRAYRRQGVGRSAVALLREAVWSREKRVTVDALVANAPAVAFWRSVGFGAYSLALEARPEGEASDVRRR